MLFKDDDVRLRWINSNPHSNLTLLLHDAEAIYQVLYGIHPTMTCASRTRAESEALYAPDPAPPSPHETDPLRAVDFRSQSLMHEQNTEFAGIMNHRWSYDAARPEKKCVLYHKVGGNVWHLHLQVCDGTRKNPMEAV